MDVGERRIQPDLYSADPEADFATLADPEGNPFDVMQV